MGFDLLGAISVRDCARLSSAISRRRCIVAAIDTIAQPVNLSGSPAQSFRCDWIPAEFWSEFGRNTAVSAAAIGSCNPTDSGHNSTGIQPRSGWTPSPTWSQSDSGPITVGFGPHSDWNPTSMGLDFEFGRLDRGWQGRKRVTGARRRRRCRGVAHRMRRNKHVGDNLSIKIYLKSWWVIGCEYYKLWIVQEYWSNITYH